MTKVLVISLGLKAKPNKDWLASSHQLQSNYGDEFSMVGMGLTNIVIVDTETVQLHLIFLKKTV